MQMPPSCAGRVVLSGPLAPTPPTPLLGPLSHLTGTAINFCSSAALTVNGFICGNGS